MLRLYQVFIGWIAIALAYTLCICRINKNSSTTFPSIYHFYIWCNRNWFHPIPLDSTSDVNEVVMKASLKFVKLNTTINSIETIRWAFWCAFKPIKVSWRRQKNETKKKWGTSIMFYSLYLDAWRQWSHLTVRDAEKKEVEMHVCVHFCECVWAKSMNRRFASIEIAFMLKILCGNQNKSSVDTHFQRK